MSILSANLKHLYQKRSFWLLGLVLVLFAISRVFSPTDSGASYYFSAVWILIAAVFIVSLPLEVLIKPFSYCLPGHRKVPRKLLFLIGFVLSFLWSLTVLLYPDLDRLQTFMVALSVFSFYTLIYWLAIWMVFRFKNGSAVVMFALALAFWPTMVSDWWLPVLNYALLENQWPIILIGALVNILAWRHLGREDLARRYCGKLWVLPSDAWNKQKLKNFKAERLEEKEEKQPDFSGLFKSVAEFLFSKMKQAKTGSLQQYIWGSLYKPVSVLAVNCSNKNIVTSVLFFVSILCFLFYLSTENMVLFVFSPAVLVIHANLGVNSSLLIRDGRRERFWSALSMATVIAVMLTTALMLLTLGAHLLQGVMPQLNIKGQEWIFTAPDLNLLPVPLLIIPFGLALGVIFQKNPAIKTVFPIMLISTVLYDSVFSNIITQTGFAYILLMIFSCWALFIAVLWHISMRHSLVGQSK